MFTNFLSPVRDYFVLESAQIPSGTSTSVPNITPNYSGPGTEAAKALAGQAAGLGLVVFLIAFVIFAVLFGISFQSHSSGLRKTGGIGMICAVIGAALLTGAAAFINYGMGLDLAPAS